MSSADVRAALVRFIEGGSIKGLNKVHRAPPYWADGSEWDLANNLGSGAIAGIHLAEDEDSRISNPAPNTLGGPVGEKMVHYRVGLMIFYQFLLPSATLDPTLFDEASWADPLDVIIDGVKALLRSDPNCGMPTVIWQSAQDARDIRIQRDIPRRLPGKVLSWNVVEFNVYEVIQA